jgi:predicted nucleic acid-binding protein
VNAKWVVNASPLILLAKVHRLGLLVELAQTVVIPESVAAEIKAGPDNDPARGWLAREGVEFIRPDLVLAPSIAAWDLGGGEQAVINWVFHHLDHEAILDDRAARKCARILGINYRGTLGVVLAAKQRGLIPQAKPVFDELISAGLLVDLALVQGALRLVGES